MKTHEYQITINGELLSNQFYWTRLMGVLEEIKIRHAPKGPALPDISVVEKGNRSDDCDEPSATKVTKKQKIDLMIGDNTVVETATGKIIQAGKVRSGRSIPKAPTRTGDYKMVLRGPEYSFPASWRGRPNNFSLYVGEFIDQVISVEWRDRITSTRYATGVQAFDPTLTDNVRCLIESELNKGHRLPSIHELAYTIYRPTETTLTNHYFNQKLRKMIDLGSVKNTFVAKEAQNGYVSLDYLLSEIKPLSVKALWTKLIKAQPDPSYAQSVVAKKFFSTYLVYTILVECVNRYGFFPSREFLVGIYVGILDKNLGGKSGEIPNKILTTGNFKTKLGFPNPGHHVANILTSLCDAEILEVIRNEFNEKLNWHEFRERSYFSQVKESLPITGGGPSKSDSV